MTKPELPTLHHLACSGGTVFSRCISAMEQIALLSEQHPDQMMARRVHPMHQAIRAGIPVTSQDIHDSFLSQISTVHDRAREAGLKLCIRDHAHRDFYEADRSYCLSIEVLSEYFRVIPLYSTRDPIDIYLGLEEAGWLRHDVPSFCLRYLAFARAAAPHAPIRYEDFVLDPDSTLQLACERLRLPFDPQFRSRLGEVEHMTGSSGRQSLDIRPRPRRPLTEDIASAFLECEEYHESIRLLGYESLTR